MADLVAVQDASFCISSVSAQELLGMQRPGKETGYCYALPYMVPFTSVRAQYYSDHLKYRLAALPSKHKRVSPMSDRLVLPRSNMAPESIELGHAAVSAAHTYGWDRLFREYARCGLRGNKLKRVMGKWELIRTEISVVIPLDNEIASMSILLANHFVDTGRQLKGTIRNTRNDMLVAATSQVTGAPLVSRDTQLMKFYERNGWTVEESASLMVATPIRQESQAQPTHRRGFESRRYVNRPKALRAAIDYSRSPNLR